MCNCNMVMNEKLVEKNLNTMIDEPFLIKKSTLDLVSGRVKIVTAKADINVRKKPVTVFATYCPFCGEKYTKSD